MAKSARKTYKNGLDSACEILLARASLYRGEAEKIGPGRIEKAEILEELAAEIAASAKQPLVTTPTLNVA